MDIDKQKLVSYIKKLNEPKVLVVGDLALDEMENMGLMLPTDEATVKAYEKHMKRRQGDK